MLWILENNTKEYHPVIAQVKLKRDVHPDLLRDV